MRGLVLWKVFQLEFEQSYYVHTVKSLLSPFTITDYCTYICSICMFTVIDNKKKNYFDVLLIRYF